MNLFYKIFIWTIICQQTVHAAKILGFFPTPSLSHNIVHNALIFELAKRGHEITMVVALKPLQPIPPNMRLIQLPASDPNGFESAIKKQMSSSANSYENFIEMIGMMAMMNYEFEYMINHPNFLQIKNETFDLAIIGWCVNDFVFGVASHFNVPAIISVPNRPNSFIRSYTGNPSGIAYLSSSFGDKAAKGQMSFFGRLQNFFSVSFEILWAWGFEYFLQRPLYEKNFPSDRYPSYDDMMKNIALVLVSHHFSQGSMEAYLPAMVEVGGMHIKSKPSPLPKDIQEWIDGATDGVIYFSMGSNVKSKYLSAEKISDILKTFAKLKQRVIWKYENDELPNKPNNVMINKWLPQSDILAHPNVKLFISHCGLGSINEAKYHGVPILGIPVFGDQPGNLQAILNAGWAVGLPFAEITEETFSNALQEMLTNSTYSNIIKNIANLYKDRPQTALETAVYWVEYVIRHKGAKHMQSPAVHLNFFQYHSLDVIGFIFACVYCVWKILKFIVCRTFRACCKSKVKSKRD